MHVSDHDEKSSLLFENPQHIVALLDADGRIPLRRQCGPVVRALSLRSGDPGFKTRSDHSLNLILVIPSSTSQLHL